MNPSQPLTAMITGGNSGIGFATVKKLTARGYRVLLASRNQDATQKAIAAIRAEQPEAQVEALELDLASFASIRACVDAFHETGYPLHLLINNAGGSIAGEQARFTEDGFEMTFGINHLGHFLFTNLLLDDLKKSAPARVITVASQLHNPKSPGPKADFDYDNLKGEKYYHQQIFYRNSKLANIWFAYELNRRLAGTGVTSNAVCPGFVPAAIGARRETPLAKFMFTRILPKMPFARSLAQASDSYLVAATQPEFGREGGQFIADSKAIASSEASYDEAEARILWEKSLAWCGLKEAA
jgi:retinol dehydrogenase-12